jgi:hypothetical protein
MHSGSTNGPQVFHRPASWRTVVRYCTFGAVIAGAVGRAGGQEPTPSATYRVFLKNGDALPSYGEAAVVADRIIFNLSMGGSDGPLTLQLVSLPLPSIDLERTNRYVDSMRAAFYAATRGEADYAAMHGALSRDLEQLAKIEDRGQQLAMAEQLRIGLATWLRTHFFYRTGDVEKLVGLVGDVIDELKASVGEKTVTFELTAGPATPRRELLMAAPGLRESIALSLSAVSAADIAEERIAILKSVASIVPSDSGLTGAITSQLRQELEAERSYGALAADIRKRAQTAETAGNVQAIDRLEAELLTRDKQFGSRRPATVQRLIDELRSARASAVVRHDTLTRYAAVRQTLLAYERAVRPAFAALDGVRSVLESYRESRVVSFERTVTVGDKLNGIRQKIEDIPVPLEASAIHATIVSALRMAVEAASRRREAAVTNAAPPMRAASSAAAGALLLLDRARSDLVNSLCMGARTANCGSQR